MGLTSFESAPEQSNIPRQYLHTESTVAELVVERPARLEASATQAATTQGNMQQQQQRSFSNPSQYSWNSALKDIQSAQRMDEVFSKVCSVSQSCAKLAALLPLCWAYAHQLTAA